MGIKPKDLVTHVTVEELPNNLYKYKVITKGNIETWFKTEEEVQAYFLGIYNAERTLNWY